MTTSTTSQIFCCRLLCITLYGTAAVQSHRQLAFASRRLLWYTYDAQLQQTLACGWKGKTTDFPILQKKRKVAFPTRNTLKIEMLEGQKHFLGTEKGKKTVMSFATFIKLQIHPRDQLFLEHTIGLIKRALFWQSATFLLMNHRRMKRKGS